MYSVVPSVAVVGATGAVGEVMRQVLTERKFPLRAIKFLASARSAGKIIDFQGKKHPVEELRPEAFAGVDIVLSSTPAGISREYSPIAARAGAIVVDNSSAWRMDPEVPLVVPEVNADALARIPKGIVANPNCSTIQMVVALKPLHDAARIKRVVVATYQASSGKGAKALFELDSQVAAVGRGETPAPAATHAAQLAGNVLPHDWKAGAAFGAMPPCPMDSGSGSWPTTCGKARHPTPSRSPRHWSSADYSGSDSARPDRIPTSSMIGTNMRRDKAY